MLRPTNDDAGNDDCADDALLQCLLPRVLWTGSVNILEVVAVVEEDFLEEEKVVISTGSAVDPLKSFINTSYSSSELKCFSSPSAGCDAGTPKDISSNPAIGSTNKEGEQKDFKTQNPILIGNLPVPG